jgi:hypothetical protein
MVRILPSREGTPASALHPSATLQRVEWLLDACASSETVAQFLREHRSAALQEMSARASCSSTNKWTEEEMGN